MQGGARAHWRRTRERVSGKYKQADDIGAGHATHHQFFTSDLQFIDKRVLTDVLHIDLTLLFGTGDVIHFVTSTDLWGDMIVIQYDASWNYPVTKTLKLHQSAPEGLACDGRRFYISYIDDSLSKPFEPGGQDNIRLAAFDANWNLLDDIAVAGIAPDEHRAPGRPSLTLRNNASISATTRPTTRCPIRPRKRRIPGVCEGLRGEPESLERRPTTACSCSRSAHGQRATSASALNTAATGMCTALPWGHSLKTHQKR